LTKSIFQFAQSEQNQRETSREMFTLQVEKGLKKTFNYTDEIKRRKFVWVDRKSKCNKKERNTRRKKGK